MYYMHFSCPYGCVISCEAESFEANVRLYDTTRSVNLKPNESKTKIALFNSENGVNVAHYTYMVKN